MRTSRPGVGDRVLLRDGISGSGRNRQACRIVSVLPAEHGEPEYRVRFDSENFERRITLSDIDDVEPSSVTAEKKEAAKAKGEPWLKPSSIRVGR
ncbi:MAG: cold-shock protein [Allorhizobium sp.]